MLVLLLWESVRKFLFNVEIDNMLLTELVIMSLVFVMNLTKQLDFVNLVLMIMNLRMMVLAKLLS